LPEYLDLRFQIQNVHDVYQQNNLVGKSIKEVFWVRIDGVAANIQFMMGITDFDQNHY
jgi:hypothetical protein